MLKALELVGFKSFADRTRLEFPRGITCVVGPNGSGKSNVVDAIKWVLGEQSVKSLRGKEMADVIFNGSGSRAPLNSAETTLTFDNSNRILPIDTPEVHITRRVYRSGEGEYLINRQPSRLRDIRDLFSGTGVASEAYSVIEQGKVDGMLQSSPKDRRAIFEEAAGISRFKAKKLESLRRLERVEQNLLRLSDIVEEVENRLRSVRMQATKARRYKEHVDRLQDLRTQVALVDWRALSERLAVLEQQIGEIEQQRAESASQGEAAEAQVLQIDALLSDTGEAVREVEGRFASNRERIATCEAAMAHARQRIAELAEEAARHRRQQRAMSLRAGDLRQQLEETLAAVKAAERQHEAAGEQLRAKGEQLAESTRQLEQLTRQHRAVRNESIEQMRASAALGNEVSALESRIESLEATRQQTELQQAELHVQQTKLADELAQLRNRQQQLAAEAAEAAARLEAAREELARHTREQTVLAGELHQLRERQAGAKERADVLEELERRLEGLGAGVKEVLVRSQEAEQSTLGRVHGLVADLLRANFETAALVDVALGEKSQYLVIDAPPDLVARLERQSSHLQGRVGFVPLAAEASPEASTAADLAKEHGVIGRAADLVEVPTELSGLAQRLLAGIWVVQSLADAVHLAAGRGRGQTLVTLAGERVDADGSICVGPAQASVGLISRRSELRTLRSQVSAWDADIRQKAATLRLLQQQIEQDQQQVARLAEAHQRASDKLAGQRLLVGASEQRQADLGKQIESLVAAAAEAAAQRDQTQAACSQAQSRHQLASARLAELETREEGLLAELEEAATLRAAHDEQTTAAKVELAKSEERLANLRSRRAQFEQDQQERARGLQEARAQLAACQQRAAQAERSILQNSSVVAELYLLKEHLQREAAEGIARREILRGERQTQASMALRCRTAARKLDEELHQRQLAANEVRVERTALADRLRDDYAIELAELEHEANEEQQHEREAADTEIAELRRKIQGIGNVNLEALGELEELETRYQTLKAQFDDLTQAKKLLEQIIQKINVDSRRLFVETLDAVRVNFQALFRKLFGGGHADIIVEEGEDVLDSGIEIIARPPGKEPRNISLLSGGEKTLTCVALLLAIFQYRPSPFCVLDEVDAALDEANIERFIGVLQEFLAWTQFIVVTHSKKTMTCASTLYGVTMQESGVSKRVSVRFEDVSDDGHILVDSDTAADAASSSPSDDETQAA